MALHLQERGHEVVGIDVSPLAVEVSKRRGVADARVLSVTQVGPRLGRFDTFVMFGNNFGLMSSARRVPWLLRRFRSIANDGARILAGSTNPYTTDNPEHLAYTGATELVAGWVGSSGFAFATVPTRHHGSTTCLPPRRRWQRSRTAPAGS